MSDRTAQFLLTVCTHLGINPEIRDSGDGRIEIETDDWTNRFATERAAVDYLYSLSDVE